MSELYLHGDYRKVISSSVCEEDIRTIKPQQGCWGIGLGASDVPAGFGEALMLGELATFLPSGDAQKPVFAECSFKSGFFIQFELTASQRIYSAPSVEWSYYSILEQIYGELVESSEVSGLYAFVMAGQAVSFDVQALIKAPLEANRPANGRPINSLDNFHIFLRRNRDKFQNVPFVSCGVFFIPSRMQVHKYVGLIEPAFGSTRSKGDLFYHSHAAVFEPSRKFDVQSIGSPSQIEEIAKDSIDGLLSVEHVLPKSYIFEACLFVSSIETILPYPGE